MVTRRVVAGAHVIDYKHGMSRSKNGALRRLTFLHTLAFSALSTSAALGEEPWLYRFEIGDHLIYERRTNVLSQTAGQPVERTADQIELWCLERTGAEAVVLLSSARAGGQEVQSPRGLLLYVDERGRQRMPEVIRTRVSELAHVLDVLPVLRTALQDESVWRISPDILGVGRTCTRVGPDPDHAGHLRVDYVLDLLRSVADGLGWSGRGRYWFDAEAGVVMRVEIVEEQRAADRRTEAVVVLRQRDRQTAAWTGRRAEEGRRYLQTLQHEDRLLDDLTRRPLEVPTTLERLDRLWVGRLQDFEPRGGSPLERLAQARRTWLAANQDALRADARYARRWLNQPALPWSLQTVDGCTLTSEQVRQGPSLECLWSTDSPGFLATWDALRTLHEQLADQHVSVVGLNVDGDTERARRVLAGLPGGPIPVLAGPLRAVDDPPRLPVVRALDEHGVVRRIWLGWRPAYPDAAEFLRGEGK